MLIPVAIHKDTDSLYGVTVPDIPGCFSAGETIEEALSNTREAIVFHLEGMLEDGEAVTVSTRQIEELAQEMSVGRTTVVADYAGATWALIDVDLQRLSLKQTRFNVSWPEYLLARIDAYAEAHHETRSGLLAKAAERYLSEQRAHETN